MWGTLLSLLGGLAQQQGQTQQSDMLNRRRQYYQQLLSGTMSPMAGRKSAQIFGQNDSDLFGLASLLGGQSFGQTGQSDLNFYGNY